jgi:hypothetical protein
MIAATGSSLAVFYKDCLVLSTALERSVELALKEEVSRIQLLMHLKTALKLPLAFLVAPMVAFLVPLGRSPLLSLLSGKFALPLANAVYMGQTLFVA